MFSELDLLFIKQSLKDRLQSVCMSPLQAEVEAAWFLEAVKNKTAPEAQQQNHLEQSDCGSSTLSEAEAERLEGWLIQRIDGRVPIQYILEEAWFYGMAFQVRPGVLIPRPETEGLVEAAFAWLETKHLEMTHSRSPREVLKVLELGTGSGCIAISLAKQCLARELPVEILALDNAEVALEIAALNANRLLGAEQTVLQFQRRDGFKNLLKNPVHLFLSNPPYVDPALEKTLQPEVAWHEPHQALFPTSGDPYQWYRHFAEELSTWLLPGGHCLLELGDGMAPTAEALFKAAGFHAVQTKPDLSGIPRILEASLAA